MAEDWKTAYGRLKMELDKYKETIVPALMEKVQELDRRWIPVTERLPDEDGDYLVFKRFYGNEWSDVLSFAKDGRKVSECTFGEKWPNVWFCYDREWGYTRTDSVTHWMPLPEPPEEE